MTIAGLDFGTSNSALGVIQAGNPVLMPLESDKPIVPSAIFYNIEENAFKPEQVFGRQALLQYIEGYEGRLMRSLKSLLGTHLIHEKTQIGKQNIAFSIILQDFLKHLKQQAEKASGQNLQSLVCGRPVYFIDDDTVADKKAQDFLATLLKNIGFKQIEFVYEPVAAAMDYERTLTQERLAMIVDIGGGTSDFSVIKISPEGGKKSNRQEDILANDGVHIGGNDFDRLLNIATVMPALGYKSAIKSDFGSDTLDVPVGYFHDLATWHKINFLYTEAMKREFDVIYRKSTSPELWKRFVRVVDDRNGHRLALDIEKAKIDLTAHDATSIVLDYIEKDWQMPIAVTQLENCLQETILTLHKTIMQTIHKANVTADDIDVVFLTGGGTYLPVIKKLVHHIFPHATQATGNHFGSIATGLTSFAHHIFK